MITENNYFEGNVKSLGYQNAEGKSTIGIINPGEYEFGTASKEIMQIIEGELLALLPGNSEWVSYKTGQHFEVEAGTSFKVKATVQTAYLCQYR